MNFVIFSSSATQTIVAHTMTNSVPVRSHKPEIVRYLHFHPITSASKTYCKYHEKLRSKCSVDLLEEFSVHTLSSLHRIWSLDFVSFSTNVVRLVSSLRPKRCHQGRHHRLKKCAKNCLDDVCSHRSARNKFHSRRYRHRQEQLRLAHDALCPDDRCEPMFAMLQLQKWNENRTSKKREGYTICVAYPKVRNMWRP